LGFARFGLRAGAGSGAGSGAGAPLPITRLKSATMLLMGEAMIGCFLALS
jgi:hypothetical protein